MIYLLLVLVVLVLIVLLAITSNIDRIARCLELQNRHYEIGTPVDETTES